MRKVTKRQTTPLREKEATNPREEEKLSPKPPPLKNSMWPQQLGNVNVPKWLSWTKLARKNASGIARSFDRNQTGLASTESRRVLQTGLAKPKGFNCTGSIRCG